jgi:hypothetical protein
MDTKNLDIYGNGPLEWSRVERGLEAAEGQDFTYFLSTVRPDGRPHTAGVGALWVDGKLYFVSGPGTRKSKNLAERPDCAVSVRLPGIDVVLEGVARRVTDAPTLERLAKRYDGQGWPAKVDGDAFTAPYSAPSAGRPPWYLYEMQPTTAFGVAGGEPHGATRWRF